jgi:excinuclease ABC subunit B
MGRASRNVHGKAILYADKVTESMRRALSETKRRRELQEEYNRQNGITPETIVKSIGDILGSVYEQDYPTIPAVAAEDGVDLVTAEELGREIKKLDKAMRQASQRLEFEKAAEIRDRIRELRQLELFDDLSPDRRWKQ